MIFTGFMLVGAWFYFSCHCARWIASSIETTSTCTMWLVVELVEDCKIFRDRAVYRLLDRFGEIFYVTTTSCARIERGDRIEVTLNSDSGPIPAPSCTRRPLSRNTGRPKTPDNLVGGCLLNNLNIKDSRQRLNGATAHKGGDPQHAVLGYVDGGATRVAFFYLGRSHVIIIIIS